MGNVDLYSLWPEHELWTFYSLHIDVSVISLSISISSISIYLISNFNTHRYMHILKSSKEFHWYTSLQANLYQVLFLLLLMSAGINQFLLRLSAVLYTGDSQRELSKKPYGFNLVTAMISWLPSAYSAVHFSVIELAVLQEKTGKRKQLYARRQNQEHWLQQMKQFYLWNHKFQVLWK